MSTFAVSAIVAIFAMGCIVAILRGLYVWLFIEEPEADEPPTETIETRRRMNDA